MALLKSLFNRFLAKARIETATAANRYEQLEILLERHSFIEIKFPRLQQSFQSMILELHPESGYLLVDELYPPAGRQALIEGDIAEVSGRASGVDIAFFSRLLLREVVDDLPVYRMELPDEIGAHQRRSAYRIYVGRETDLLIDIRPLDDVPLDAGIVNLSSEGIKLNIEGDVLKLLERHPQWSGCLIRLPDGTDIDCDIEVRNAYLMRTPNQHTLVGAKLNIAHPQQRTRLNQYLAAVQRKQRRRELRLG